MITGCIDWNLKVTTTDGVSVAEFKDNMGNDTKHLGSVFNNEIIDNTKDVDPAWVGIFDKYFMPSPKC